MKEITKIVIKSESGFFPVSEHYSDKLTITKNSIRYIYYPIHLTNVGKVRDDVAHKWSYKTDSALYQEIFDLLTVSVQGVLNRKDWPVALDTETITFIVTYADKSKVAKEFFLPSAEFKDCFDIVKKMIPVYEYVPKVLMAGED